MSLGGWSINTYLHTVADGALWIHRQALMHLGKNGSFLLDFFHVCEFLAAAKNPKTGEQWLELQRKRLKDGRQKEVLQALLAFVEPDDVPDEQAPARQAHRYLQNRIDQLDYKSAIENDLPIGSGMIEGAHRHVLQKRIKISAAWWREDNLLAMAHLRVCRANQLENSYWLVWCPTNGVT